MSSDDDQTLVSAHAYKVAFDVLVTCLATSRKTAMHHITNRLLSIDWENRGNPAIPDDFDPIGYLLRNGDLWVSDVKPFLHYVTYGKREGRGWKAK